MNQDPSPYLQQLESLGPVGQWAYQKIIHLVLEVVQLRRELQETQAQVKQLEEQLQEVQRRTRSGRCANGSECPASLPATSPWSSQPDACPWGCNLSRVVV